MFKLIAILMTLLLLGCSSVPVKNNNNPNAAVNANLKLAMALLNQGYIKEAKEKLLLAKKLDDSMTAVWYSLAYFYEKVGEVSEAMNCYQYAISIAPYDGATNNNYAVFLYRRGQYQEALHYFMLAITDSNYLDTALTYQNAGLCALKMSDKLLARKYFHEALNHDPTLKIPEARALVYKDVKH